MAKKTNEKKFEMTREEYIEYLSLKSNEITMNNGNTKTGKCVHTLSFPVCTCRDDAPCKENGCYCLKGHQTMARVVSAYVKNLRLYNTDPMMFWEQVKFKLKINPLPLFRYTDAGDIPDYEFINGMVDIANCYPNIKFLAYTKKYDMINRWITENGNFPNNLTVRFSAWHCAWDVPNPHNLPMAYVDFKDSTLTPELPSKISGCPNQKDKTITCSTCQKCWNKKIENVVFKQH